MSSQKGRMIFKNVEGNLKDHYELGKVLGSGAFATVRLAQSIQTKENVAVKIVDKSNVEINDLSLRTEVAILQHVDHPNIVKLFEVYETPQKVFLVMELLTGGELFDRIINKYPNGYSEQIASALISKIISAIDYLHSIGIVHRDLKPENLIFASDSEDSEIKVSDFGLAKIAREDVMIRTACGTPSYVAPEVLQNKGYSATCDMWSIGVILYILLCGYPPFYSESTPDLFQQIIGGKYDFPDEYWGEVSAGAKDLIVRLLQVDPKKRMTPKQALAHPWIVNNTNTQNMKGSVMDQLKKFSAKKKWKVGLDAVLAANRLMKVVEG